MLLKHNTLCFGHLRVKFSSLNTHSVKTNKKKRKKEKIVTHLKTTIKKRSNKTSKTCDVQFTHFSQIHTNKMSTTDICMYRHAAPAPLRGLNLVLKSNLCLQPVQRT